MSIKPIKTWSYPGALLDALVDTRKAVADIELPIPTDGAEQARALVTQTLDQLDHHLIPRVDGRGLARDRGGGRFHGLRQVDRGQRPARRATDAVGRAAAHHQDALPLPPPARHPGAHRRGASGNRDRHRRRCRAASRSSTRQTSIRCAARTARSPANCSTPPTCGSSSPRPRATATPCRGRRCGPAPSVAHRSRSSSTASRWTSPPRCAATSCRGSATRGSRCCRCS